MDGGEKRKSPDDDEDEDDDEDTGKRREGEEKIAKKPGRKLITTEPTTVSLFAFFSHASCILMCISETKSTKSGSSTSIP